MACNGCGNCEAIGRVVQWQDALLSFNERFHALCTEIPPRTTPQFNDIDLRLQAIYRGFVPGDDEVLDRFIQVTKVAKSGGVPLSVTEFIGVTLGLALDYGLSVETRKKAMTLFCDIYEASTL